MPRRLEKRPPEEQRGAEKTQSAGRRESIRSRAWRRTGQERATSRERWRERTRRRMAGDRAPESPESAWHAPPGQALRATKLACPRASVRSGLLSTRRGRGDQHEDLVLGHVRGKKRLAQRMQRRNKSDEQRHPARPEEKLLEATSLPGKRERHEGTGALRQQVEWRFPGRIPRRTRDRGVRSPVRMGEGQSWEKQEQGVSGGPSLAGSHQDYRNGLRKDHQKRERRYQIRREWP